jgi:hypothetical protein
VGTTDERSIHPTRVAAQFRHLQGGFDGAQVKLHVRGLICAANVNGKRSDTTFT